MQMPSTLWSSRKVAPADPACGEQATGKLQRRLASLAPEAAEQLRQAHQVEVTRGFELRIEDAQRERLVVVARGAGGDQGVVVRPDRAVVIRHRVVAQLALADRAHAPAREEMLVAEPGDDLPRAFGMRDAGEQAVPRVRGAHATGLFVAVERQRVGFDVRAPERGVEARLQRLRGFDQRDGARRFTERAGDARGAEAGRRRRSPALRTAPGVQCARRPSAWNTASGELFQPCCAGPAPRGRVSTKPSPSTSPYTSIQRSAAVIDGHSSAMSSRSAVRV